MTIKDDILKLVSERRNVSFAEVGRLPGAAGDCAIEHGTSNVIFWTGLSLDAAEAIADLRVSGQIHFNPTDVVTYFIDGSTQRLPLVKSPAAMARGYKTPHWLPVVIEPGPDPVYGAPR
jgi:hypothetical protein